MSIFNIYRTKKDASDILSGDINIGDRIEFKLGKHGTQSATACYKEENMIMFIFDNVLGMCKPNLAKDFLQNEVKNEFPEYFGDVELELPSCGMIFGDAPECRYFYTNDNDEQFIFMKKRINRDCDYMGKPTGWILSNKDIRDIGIFPVVSKFGNIGHIEKNKLCGVRPIFWIEAKGE